jgi:hypothetical protein
MNQKQLYSLFEELAEKMNVTLIEGKGDFDGGYCTVNGDQFIVLNKIRPMRQRLRVLAKSFSILDIHDRYLVPALRDFIESVR